MFDNTWNRIINWFRDRADRSAVVRGFNMAARDAFVSGNAPTLLEASISRGCSDYRHSFSNWLNSGFRIKAFSGRQLTKSEIVSIGETILSDDVLVRRLVVLGWDTLEVHCDEGDYGCRWQIKEFLDIVTGKPEIGRAHV